MVKCHIQTRIHIHDWDQVKYWKWDNQHWWIDTSFLQVTTSKIDGWVLKVRKSEIRSWSDTDLQTERWSQCDWYARDWDSNCTIIEVWVEVVGVYQEESIKQKEECWRWQWKNVVGCGWTVRKQYVVIKSDWWMVIEQ